MEPQPNEQWATEARGYIEDYREERGKHVYTVGILRPLGTEFHYIDVTWPDLQKYVTYETYREFDEKLDQWTIPPHVERLRRVHAATAEHDKIDERERKRAEREQGREGEIPAEQEPVELSSAQRARGHWANTPTDRAARASSPPQTRGTQRGRGASKSGRGRKRSLGSERRDVDQEADDQEDGDGKDGGDDGVQEQESRDERGRQQQRRRSSRLQGLRADLEKE